MKSIFAATAFILGGAQAFEFQEMGRAFDNILGQLSGIRHKIRGHDTCVEATCIAPETGSQDTCVMLNVTQCVSQECQYCDCAWVGPDLPRGFMEPHCIKMD